MSRKNFKNKKRSNILVGVLSALVTLFAISALGMLSDGFSNWNVVNWVTGTEQVFEDVDDYNIKWTTANKLSDSYASYDDKELFEDTTIKRIGLPVDSIAAYDKDAVFTVLVVKITNLESTSAMEDPLYSEELVIKRNTYDRNEIHEWVYFDVDIEVGEGETLVFGITGDTIYLSKDAEGTNKLYNYNFLAGEDTLNKGTGSLLIDILYKEN